MRRVVVDGGHREQRAAGIGGHRPGQLVGGVAGAVDDGPLDRLVVRAALALEVEAPAVAEPAHHHEGDQTGGQDRSAGHEMGPKTRLTTNVSAVVTPTVTTRAATSSKLPKRQRPV